LTALRLRTSQSPPHYAAGFVRKWGQKGQGTPKTAHKQKNMKKTSNQICFFKI
jgi:hypothetical protein